MRLMSTIDAGDSRVVISLQKAIRTITFAKIPIKPGEDGKEYVSQYHPIFLLANSQRPVISDLEPAAVDRLEC